MTKTVKVGPVKIGGKNPLALIAGPCVIEGRRACLEIAGKLAGLASKQKIPFVFKASYDKANRSSINSYRGPGMAKGLEILAEIKEKYGVPILTDVHSEAEVASTAGVADILQIPAFLSRQTDLLVAAAESGKVVNVKKGQFMAPGDIKNVIDKLESTGTSKIMVTERGTSFGYHNLVADMRSLPIMGELGYPVVFDATHSVQRPGGEGDRSGGDGWLVPHLAKAAVAVGCDAIFMEVHPSPEKALSDSANSLAFSKLDNLWKKLKSIDEIK